MVRTLFLTLALGSCLAPGISTAQQPEPRTVAKLKDIEGSVLVSQGDAMTAGAKDQRLQVNTRVVTTAGAKVTIAYDKGCDVRLDENKRFTVRELGECAALIASVEGLVLPAAAGGLGAAQVIGATAIAVGIGAVIREGNRNVSPN